MSLAPVWWLIVLSFQPAIPVWAGLLASITLLIGGGNSVLTAVLLSIVTDLAPEGSRAILFMRIHVASLVGFLISPALCSAMMNATGPRPVLCMAVILQLTCALSASLFIPETLHPSHTSTPSKQSFKSHLSNAFNQLKQSLQILNRPLTLLVFALLITAPAYYSNLQFMAQYISKHYAIKLKDTGYIQTIYGGAQVLVAFIGIPLASKLLTPKNSPSPRSNTTLQNQQRDFKLAFFSFFIFIPSLLFLSIAPTLPIFILALLILSLGSGYSSFAKALMSAHVSPEQRSRLFTLVGVGETVGTLYSGPVMAGLFSAGMRMGGGWIGLPYAVVGVWCLGAVVCVWFVGGSKSEVVVGEEGEEEGNRGA